MVAGKGRHYTTYPRRFNGEEIPSTLPDELVGPVEVRKMADSEYSPADVADLAVERLHESEKAELTKEEFRTIVLSVVGELGCPQGAAEQMVTDQYMGRITKHLRSAKHIKDTAGKPGVWTVLPPAPAVVQRDEALEKLVEKAEEQQEVIRTQTELLGQQRSDLEEKDLVIDQKDGEIRRLGDEVKKLTQELEELEERPTAGIDPVALEQLLSKYESVTSELTKLKVNLQTAERTTTTAERLRTEAQEQLRRAEAALRGKTKRVTELEAELRKKAEQLEAALQRVETLEKVQAHKEVSDDLVARLKAVGIDI